MPPILNKETGPSILEGHSSACPTPARSWKGACRLPAQLALTPRDMLFDSTPCHLSSSSVNAHIRSDAVMIAVIVRHVYSYSTPGKRREFLVQEVPSSC